MLGFRRLSILDVTSKGDQPRTSIDQRWALVYNGELYNYRSLQADIRLSDAELRSSSDSEILVRYIESRGIPQTLPHLNGMFAFSVYDRRTGELHLVRDQAGIKPLYYGWSSHGIVFASQFDQVSQHPWLQTSLTLDIQVLSDQMALGYMPAPGTIYREIRQVEPGQHLVFRRDGTVSSTFYWKWKDNPSIDETTAQLSGDFLELFSTVVRDQLASDVPIGSFLSGGIDSPLVSAMAVRERPDLELFSIGVDDDVLDESVAARRYAEHLNARHELEYFTTERLREQLDAHFDAFPEPFGDYSSLPSFQVCGMATRRFTVALSGDGGDELFWGYPRFLNVVRHRGWFRQPRAMRRAVSGLARKAGARISYGIDNDSIGTWVLHAHSHNKPSDLAALFPSFGYSDTVQTLYSSPSHFPSDEELLLWLRRNEFYGHLQRVLVKVDRTSMYHSLEVRVPFLDQRVIAFAQSLRPGLGRTHHEPKHVLRKAAIDVFGSDLVTREKKGFSVPIDRWLREDLHEELDALLVHRDPWPHNSFDRVALEAYLQRFREGRASAWGVWILYALQKWADKFAPCAG